MDMRGGGGGHWLVPENSVSVSYCTELRNCETSLSELMCTSSFVLTRCTLRQQRGGGGGSNTLHPSRPESDCNMIQNDFWSCNQMLQSFLSGHCAAPHE